MHTSSIGTEDAGTRMVIITRTLAHAQRHRQTQTEREEEQEEKESLRVRINMTTVGRLYAYVYTGCFRPHLPLPIFSRPLALCYVGVRT